MQVTKTRDLGPDIIRTIAIICVVCGHFFSVNTPFNEALLAGGSMLFQGFLKSIFCSIGVPFFLVLSGYLCCKKEFSVGYYNGLKRVIIPYFIISLITWGGRYSEHSVTDLFWGVLGFKTIGYAWYIEMYFGLFLLIPFVNIIVQKVYESRNKQMLWALVFTSLLLTALPTMVSRQGYVIVSRFWEMNFPVTFYLLGAYIRLYQPSLSWKWSSVAIVLLSINLIISYLVGVGMIVAVTGAYYSVVNIVAIYILFVLLYPIKSCCGKAIITSISIYSFEMFLFSYLIDKTLYPFFIEKFYTTQSEFLLWFVPITVCSLFLSYMCARILRLITSPILR